MAACQAGLPNKLVLAFGTDDANVRLAALQAAEALAAHAETHDFLHVRRIASAFSWH